VSSGLAAVVILGVVVDELFDAGLDPADPGEDPLGGGGPGEWLRSPIPAPLSSSSLCRGTAAGPGRAGAAPGELTARRDGKGVYGPALTFGIGCDGTDPAVDCHRRMVWSSPPVARMLPSAL
jgi:hypothetical protein